jgi:hypothetical protein
MAAILMIEECGGMLVGHVEGFNQLTRLGDMVKNPDKEPLFKTRDGTIYAIVSSEEASMAEAMGLDGWPEFEQEAEEMGASFICPEDEVPVFVVEVVGEACDDKTEDDMELARPRWAGDAHARKQDALMSQQATAAANGTAAIVQTRGG